ncbi:RadC family protein [Streptococcus sp. DD12]|uniref:RadC family protein n=1 Tax=Streptococcus sp. DD12 TaxID=1777880 RepID=UPI0007976D90|nr:DNA repair protein RadC [Streptococcus sp. DD12]KXT76577.1 DNA repair protein RadC [Streptococcus sp. DD12]
MYAIKWESNAFLPRERLASAGVEALSNQELLAILLRTGTRQKNVFELAGEFLETIGDLSHLRQMSLQEFQAIDGIGPVRATELMALVELARRIHGAELSKSERILSSDRLAQRMQVELRDQKQEHVIALYLDTQNRLIEKRTIFIGSVRRSVAEPREILYFACKNMATSLIIVHNHPSGDPTPSEMDQQFTKRMQASCQQLGIVFLDHLVIGYPDYYSFREQTDLCD